MNSKHTTVLLKRHSKDDYQSRFLLQSKNTSKKPYMNNSRALKLLGGEPVLDILCVTLAQRIANDAILAQDIYGDLNTKTLVQIQKELLLFALNNDLSTRGTKKQVYTQPILQKHVRLGLMQREAYFDRLVVILAYALNDCSCQIKDANAIFMKFQGVRPLLQVTQEQMALEKRPMQSSRFSVFGNLVGKKPKWRIFA